MTGKDLIVYILQHNLENKSLDVLTVEEYAVIHKVGVDTVYAWIYLKQLDTYLFGDAYFIPKHAKVRSKREE